MDPPAIDNTQQSVNRATLRVTRAERSLQDAGLMAAKRAAQDAQAVRRRTAISPMAQHRARAAPIRSGEAPSAAAEAVRFQKGSSA